MQRTILLCVLLFNLIASVSAQYNIRFTVVSNNKPVAFAALKAVPINDSTKVFQKVADSNGVCILKLVAGRYKVQASALNFKPVEKGISVSGDANLILVAEPVSGNLNTVVVTSTRPLMRQQDDMTIVEPENLVAASTNAYEVLEKTPGVFVDQDGNVYLSSTTPSAIYINGREMKMSNADIATMLKNLPPNAVSKIEILRSPSAKYDASGTGGIINIVLKKGVKLGMTGSVTAALQQGVYGNQFFGININNNDGKKTTYLNLNYGRRNSYETIISDRFFAADSVLSQNAFTKYQSPSYFLGYGYNNQLTKKFDIDFSGSVSYNDFDNNTENLNVVRKLSSSSTVGTNMNKVSNAGGNLYIGNGLEGKLKLDTIGSELEIDLWYSYGRNRAEQVYTNSSYEDGDGENINKRHYSVAKSDLRLKMKHRITVETGFRLSFLKFESVANYFSDNGGGRVKDLSRTNTFRYNENINAAYAQLSKTLGKDFIVKAGARVENTNMNGNQLVPRDTSFSIHRTDLFPYIYLSKKVMSIAGYELRGYLVYRRTLNRPAYDYLNPFPRYIDQFLYETGNPALRPQFTHNYEANISVDERPLIAIGVNETKDLFTNVIYADTSKAVSIRTYDNLGRNKEVYFRGLGAIPPGGKYFFVVGGQYNHNFYQGLYQGNPLSYKRGTWTFFTYHQLKLGKLSQFTLNGFVRLKGLQQFYELGPFGALNASINRQFMNQKLVVTLSMNDMFYTNKNDFSLNQGSITATGTRYADSRRFGLNIRYNFGIKKKEENNNIFGIDSPEKTN